MECSWKEIRLMRFDLRVSALLIRCICVQLTFSMRELRKINKKSPTKLLSPEGCPYEYIINFISCLFLASFCYLSNDLTHLTFFIILTTCIFLNTSCITFVIFKWFFTEKSFQTFITKFTNSKKFLDICDTMIMLFLRIK